MKYHGNYCGPNWSAGKRQPSVADSDVQPIDDFDASCQQHDRAYALSKDLKGADIKFYKENIGKGLKRSIAALAVGAQSLLRKKRKINNMAPTRPTRKGKRKVSATPSPLKRQKEVPRGPKATKAMMASKKSVSIVGRNVTLGGKLNGRKRAVKYDKYDRYGVTERLEFAAQPEDLNCLFIGHATTPQTRIATAVGRAIVKAMALKAGMPIADFRANIPNSKNNDEWVLTFRANFDAATGENIVTFTAFTGGPYSLFDVSNSVRDWIIAARNTRTTMIKMQFIPAPATAFPVAPTYSRVEIQLLKAKVSLYVRSKLTVQNQTKSLDGSVSTDVVNNSPLIGKFYEGSGNGTQHLIDSLPGQPFVCTDSDGVIVKLGSGSKNAFEEPPKATEFWRVRKTGGVSIGPGEMKTSVIVTQRTYLLNLLCMQIYNESLINHTYMRTGYYRFFALEKALGIDQEVDYPIKLAYEHDLLIKCVVTPYSLKQTAQITANVTP